MLLELSGLDEGEIEANLLGKALSFGIAGNWAQRGLDPNFLFEFLLLLNMA